MNRSLPLRLLFAALLAIGLALVLLLFLYATDLALGVWQRLENAPAFFLAIYAGILAALTAGVAWLIWRLWRKPAARARNLTATAQAPLSKAVLEARVREAELQGSDVSGARAELSELDARRATGALYIALFGEASTGKSSLIQALLPDIRPAIDARGGTTREIQRYQWLAPSGTPVVLTDLPGVNGPGGTLEEQAREEALRAHLVLYLIESDLTRRQYAEVEALAQLKKPIIMVLNKMDYYRGSQLEALRERLAERVKELGRITVLTISAGGQREVVKVAPDGREETAIREIPPRIESLLEALRDALGGDIRALEEPRDAAVHTLAAAKLDAAVARDRQHRAEGLIRDYTRNAVVGALVAVSPGSDLVIQGYLGVGMVRALCGIYGVGVSELDVTRFLRVAQAKIRKTLPLVLAVAGNALKAFPGIGTLAGGVLHAVGYGLIFESLGRAIAESLARQGGFAATPTLRIFEEQLGEDLDIRARRLVELVLAERRDSKDQKRLTQARDAS